MTAQRTESAPVTGTNLSVWRDMPTGLTPDEALAYRKGYTRTFAKLTAGTASVSHGADGAPAPGTAARRMLGRQLAAASAEATAGAHDGAHKAGIAAVRSMLRTAERAAGAWKVNTVPLPGGERRPPVPTPAADARMREILAGTARPLSAVPAPRNGKTGTTKRAARTAPAPAPVDNRPEVTAARRDMFRGMGWSVTEPAPARPVPVASEPAAGVHVIHVSDTGARELTADDIPPAPAHVTHPADTDRAHAAGVDFHRTHGVIPPGLDYVAGRAWRREARRQLAAILRERDLTPAGDVWTVATIAAGLRPMAGE